MLSYLALSDRHRENLHERGLPDEIIERNGYKSMPETEAERRLLASLLACDHELHGLPGFYTKDGTWTLAGANGFLIPVRNKDGLIQGMKIRLDDDAARKYRWLSSRSSRMENGARSYSWMHVTGDTTQKRAYLTEGPLKGDIASYFANNALFVCLGGVNAHRGCGKRSCRSASRRSWRRWTWISLQIRRSGRRSAPCAARCSQFRASGTISVPGTRDLRVWTIICLTGRNEGRLKERNCV